jgi:thymidylate synthase ThyX
MKINLAGYNVDADALELALKAGPIEEIDALTPETISAAYARISRAEDSVDKLREQSRRDVVKARKSNQNIVFDMGHNSVAEHAVLNFDIIDVSRLAIEAIEHARLCSYTEKSQRYLQLKGLDEVHMPAELQNRRGMFKEVANAQMEAYHAIRALLEADATERAHQCDKDGPTTAHKLKITSNTKEDARYVTCLAVRGQLGMTINARNLELMIRRLLAHRVEEVRCIGHELFVQAYNVVPSLLRRTDEPEMIRQPEKFEVPYAYTMSEAPQVALICGAMADDEDTRVDTDSYVLTALMHQASEASFEACSALVSTMKPPDKWRSFWSIYKMMETHSAAPRQWELPDVTMELAGSASFFAQLKRHRMATLLPQGYSLGLGVTVPPSIARVPAALDLFQRVRAQTEALYRELKSSDVPWAADYILMQAHRRRTLVKMNARELYAFARLRMDCHAQWEIREVAKKVISLALEHMPMTLALATGKDTFKVLKEHREEFGWKVGR